MSEFITTPLLYELNRAHPSVGEPQWVFVKSSNHCPDPVISIFYHNYLVPRVSGHRSQETYLRDLLYFVTWCEEKKNKPASEVILQSNIFTRTDLNNFSNWMRTRGSKTKTRDGVDLEKHPYKQIGGKTYSRVIDRTKEFLNWAVNFFLNPDNLAKDSLHLLEQKTLVKNSISEWAKEKRNAVPYRNNKIIDLTDDEIIAIDKVLHPSRRKEKDHAVVVRDYLLWRIAIEFGVRGGEILALEINDMPEGQQEYLEIRRVEDRGADYKDPRTNPPRPKTLSRVLPMLLPNAEYNPANGEVKGDYEETILSCSHVVYWWTVYSAHYRPFNTPHDFVFCEHADDEYKPLASLTCLVDYVRDKTGIKNFRAHICRHSLFTRLMLTKINSDNWERDLLDIKYYGGWKNDKSIMAYTKRAQEDLALGVVTRFQSNNARWKMTHDFREEQTKERTA